MTSGLVAKLQLRVRAQTFADIMRAMTATRMARG